MASISGCLALDLGEVLPCRGHDLAPAAPSPVERAESADVQFNIVGERFAERVEVAPDDRVVGGVKNCLRIFRVDGRRARRREQSVRVFAVHG